MDADPRSCTEGREDGDRRISRVRSLPAVDDHDQHLTRREGGSSGTEVEQAQRPRTEAPVQARPKRTRSSVPKIMNMEYLLSVGDVATRSATRSTLGKPVRRRQRVYRPRSCAFLQGVGDVAGAGADVGVLPVDQSHDPTVSPDQVPGADVTVADEGVAQA